MTGLSVGIDLVQVSRISESLAHFGERFTRRLFTADEIAYAEAAPACRAERLAARFAAKEAAKKALGLANQAIGWRDIEVRRSESGQCTLVLHNKARDHVGRAQFALSMSHEGDFATAVVVSFGTPVKSQP